MVLASAAGGEGGGAAAPAGNERVAEIQREFAPRGVMADGSAPTPPGQALAQFRVADGYRIELVAAEPQIAQPLHLSWDRRGRLWVVEYRQYPFPAGLQVLRYDQHLRAVYDRKPPPPGRDGHVPGADRLTVLEDLNGDGEIDSVKVVLEGLNLATSAAYHGRALWVLQPPYLLRYEDRSGDGMPDSPVPEVALDGFGIEDTHSIANSLRLGPDGWLYGNNGSTTSGDVTCPATSRRFRWEGQCVWRYHPKLRRFEIFSEGSGNPFALVIARDGRVFTGTNHGNTRGMYHVQGGYGEKAWGKHGPLTNPFAFGFYGHMAHQGDARRFSQALELQEDGHMGEGLAGRYLAANAMHNHVVFCELSPDRGGYRTRDEGVLIETDDRWFRPVDLKLGPDGMLYVADWYDSRLSHVSPVDDWHKDSGRIYRIVPEDHQPTRPSNLLEAGQDELVRLALRGEGAGTWQSLHAGLELQDREYSLLEIVIDDPATDRLARSQLHGLELARDFRIDPTRARWLVDTLSGTDLPSARWAARLAGDAASVAELPEQVEVALVELARRVGRGGAGEQARLTAGQLASVAGRVRADLATGLIAQLMGEGADQILVLQLWWALERAVTEDRVAVFLALEAVQLWQDETFRTELLPRLGRRLAMDPDPAGRSDATRLYDLVRQQEGGDALASRIVEEIMADYAGRPLPAFEASLGAALMARQEQLASYPLAVAVAAGDPDAVIRAIDLLTADEAELAERLALIEALVAAKQRGVAEADGAIPALLAKLRGTGKHGLKRAALRALAHFDGPEIARAILAGFERDLPAELGVRAAAAQLLATRASWARAMLEQIDQWQIRAEDLDAETVIQLLAHQDQSIDEAVARHWPSLALGAQDPSGLAEQLALRRAQLAVGEAGDFERGRELYRERCAACHRLAGEGGEIGPDLATYPRHDPGLWLPAVLAPSAEIREGFETTLLQLADGRVIVGRVEAESPATVALRDLVGELHRVDPAGLVGRSVTPISSMPAGLIDDLDAADFCALAAYLERAE
jgi:putative membrane-bound dehydrogenase-like protein